MLQKIAHTVRALTVDAVEAAQSGHPGLPLGMADVGALLYGKILRHDPTWPQWPDRDRVILSGGHGSMWLYSLLHLSGYDLPMEELKNFRQLGSATPGHPEYGDTPGVETTTGPLGQGMANAVGMALAERMLAARFNRPGYEIVGHYTYVIASDGDLMEGVVAEASSLAGHLGLGRLIVFYDDNQITIDGGTDLTFTEDVAKRYEAYGWHVLTVDGHDVAAVEEAVKAAQAETTRPSLIITKTKIGWGTPLEGTSKAHSDPMGPENIAALKAKIGWPEEPFYVPGEVREFFAARKEELVRQSQEWKERFEAWSRAYPELRAEWDKAFGLELPENLDEILPEFEPGEKVATRSAGGTVLQALAKRMPYLVGGSADLHPSTKTFIEGGGVITRDDYSGRNIHFGVREHAMGAMLNGMQLHGGLRVFGSTFLVFSDYMRPTIRLAALMRQPVVFVFTHDSVYVGEDGPTHQPVEHAESLRLIPNVEVYRPADAVEAALAWVEALKRKDGPTVLLFTRQNVPVLEREEKVDLSRGAYVIKREKNPLSAVILASGSEVSLALEAAQKLEERGRGVRVVSVPNRELFLRQDAGYQEAVAPKGTPRLVIEAGVGAGWRGLAGESGRILSIERFGVSAPGAQAAAHLGLTVDRAVALVEEMLQAG
jgi:transketolase, bacterial and yeast